MKTPIILSSLALGLLLSGCGNLSRVDEHGKADPVVWAERFTLTTRDGIYPDPARLAMVKEGMTKDQILHLIGHPHFHEGFYFVREWDYLFRLQTSSGDVTCQYKILFDKDERARTFLWREPSCADAVSVHAPAAA